MKRTTKILIGVGVLGGLVGANMWLRKSKATKAAELAKAAEEAEEPIKSPAPPQKDIDPILASAEKTVSTPSAPVSAVAKANIAVVDQVYRDGREMRL